MPVENGFICQVSWTNDDFGAKEEMEVGSYINVYLGFSIVPFKNSWCCLESEVAAKRTNMVLSIG